MFKLDKLTRLVKKRKRIGRGGSRGGMSGRGNDGQKSRSGGGVRVGFEGGQMPLYRRLPKRGFSNAPFKKEFIIVGLGRLEKAFTDGDLVTKDTLIQKGIIKSHKSNQYFLIKILGNGLLTKRLVIQAHACSESAKKVIQDLGGEINLI